MNSERFSWKHSSVIVYFCSCSLLFVTSWQPVAFATYTIAVNHAM